MRRQGEPHALIRWRLCGTSSPSLRTATKDENVPSPRTSELKINERDRLVDYAEQFDSERDTGECRRLNPPWAFDDPVDHFPTLLEQRDHQADRDHAVVTP